jgi:hypothetical protein
MILSLGEPLCRLRDVGALPAGSQLSAKDTPATSGTVRRGLELGLAGFLGRFERLEISASGAVLLSGLTDAFCSIVGILLITGHSDHFRFLDEVERCIIPVVKSAQLSNTKSR